MNAQLAAGAQHPVITKFQGPCSYIYDSKEPVVLSLGLIILRGQCVSGHVVLAPKRLDQEGLGRRRTGARYGNVLTCFKSTSHKFLKASNRQCLP